MWCSHWYLELSMQTFQTRHSFLLITHTHTHLTALFPGLPRWAGTRKVKPIWILLKQWHQLGHMQVCTSLQTDNHASTPPLSFLQAGCPSCRPTNSVKALKANHRTRNMVTGWSVTSQLTLSYCGVESTGHIHSVKHQSGVSVCLVLSLVCCCPRWNNAVLPSVGSVIRLGVVLVLWADVDICNILVKCGIS